MKIKLTIALFLFGTITLLAQTKVSGYVYDEYNQSVAFANVLFKGSSQGTITDENGRFYLESNQTWNTLVISFVGYKTLEIELAKKVNYDLKLRSEEHTSELQSRENL